MSEVFWVSTMEKLAQFILLGTTLNVIAMASISCAKNTSTDNPVVFEAPEVYELAQNITFRIDGGNPGTGFVVAGQDGTYYLLTASHVVASVGEYDITAPSGELYRIDADSYEEQITKLPNVDAAIIRLQSDEAFPVPEMRTNPVDESSAVYVVGFPGGGQDSEIKFEGGLIVSNDLATETLEDGYNLIYNSETLPGMSGGPVLDDQGRIVGIHGRAEQAAIGEGEYEKTGFNLGIPIWPIRDLILSSLEIRLSTADRLKIVSDFEPVLNSALDSGCDPVQSKSYRSFDLTSPTESITVSFEGNLVGFQDCTGTSSFPSIIETVMLVEADDATQKIKYSEPFDGYYVSVAPISFSEDGKYLVVSESVSDGFGAFISFSVLDVDDDFESTEFSEPCLDYQFGGIFMGFQSPVEAVFHCSDGGDDDEVVINLETGKITSTPLDGYAGEVDAEKFTSYGSISSEFQILDP
jgi:hypothetical protein